MIIGGSIDVPVVAGTVSGTVLLILIILMIFVVITCNKKKRKAFGGGSGKYMYYLIIINKFILCLLQAETNENQDVHKVSAVQLTRIDENPNFFNRSEVIQLLM